MKDYVFTTIKVDGIVKRRRVFRNEDIMRRYYGDLFDFSHQTKDGYPARRSANTYLSYDSILLIEARDC